MKTDVFIVGITVLAANWDCLGTGALGQHFTEIYPTFYPSMKSPETRYFQKGSKSVPNSFSRSLFNEIIHYVTLGSKRYLFLITLPN